MGGFANAQSESADTSQSSIAEELRDTSEHSVEQATYLALIPGGGQIYNSKYWKLPILYGGMGAAAYFAYDNHVQYRRFLNSFYNELDSTTASDELGQRYSQADLIRLQDTYRDWRDLSIIVGVLIYALSIVDAHVDAHLYSYDISDDLTYRFEPIMMPAGPVTAIGLSFSMQFK